MKIEKYNKVDAIKYASKYALTRNPAYYDFSSLGGDCTNFCSQCLYAGSKQMNLTKNLGWYYLSANNRSPAWAGVKQLHNFLVDNIVINKIGEGYGPFAETCNIQEVDLGDLVFLANSQGAFYHAMVVVGFKDKTPLVASHSYDALNKPLTDYNYAQASGLHILGVRK